MTSETVSIKNRYDIVIFVAEITCPANASEGVKLGQAVQVACLARADLAGAYLKDANLRGADLTGAYFMGANLRGADLAGAYLIGADLRGADLTGANLDGASLARALQIDDADIPTVPNIDAAILDAIDRDDGLLEMGDWHSCETTHCRAGWAIHLAGEAGYALEKRVGSQLAGTLIYLKSRPAGEPIPSFFASTDDALEDIRRCAAQQLAAR